MSPATTRQPTDDVNRQPPAWLWIAIAACLFNLFKPVYMDDAAYLQMAAALVEHPWHAMQALVNWDNVPQPLHYLNQPHGVPAFLAVLMAAGLHSDLALHAGVAVFTLIATAAFHRLAVLCEIRHPVAATSAFVLGPQILPGQNLMTDVPMLAMMLLALIVSRRQAWAAAGLTASVACLMKYSGLVLLPALAVVAFRARTRRAWLMLAIPAMALVAWSVFNVLDYGQVHVLGRPQPTLTPVEWLGRLAGVLVGVGAVTPITVLALLDPRRYRIQLVSALVAAVAGFFVGWFGIGTSSSAATSSTMYLRGLFFGNGVLALALAAHGLDAVPFERDQGRPLAVLVVSTIIFVVAWAPFLAVRHLLPISMVIALCMARAHLDRLSALNRLVVLMVSVGLGAALAMSDLVYARAYRQMATSSLNGLMPSGSASRTYAAGHWGWQWYTAQRGLNTYATGLTTLRPDDLIVVPCGVPKQQFPDSDLRQLTLVSGYVIPGSAWTLLRTMGVQSGTIHSGYYRGSDMALPWFLSRAPLDTILVLRVVSAPVDPFDIEASCRVLR